MDRVSKILPRILRKHGFEEVAVSSMTVKAAQDWISRFLADVSKSLAVKALKHGCLIIEADDSVALAECANRANELKIFLIETIPEARVEQVRVVRSLKR
jgi:hypothetical protein